MDVEGFGISNDGLVGCCVLTGVEITLLAHHLLGSRGLSLLVGDMLLFEGHTVELEAHLRKMNFAQGVAMTIAVPLCYKAACILRFITKSLFQRREFIDNHVSA